MPSVIYAECHYAECHYAECHYAECHFAECRYDECHSAILLAMSIFNFLPDAPVTLLNAPFLFLFIIEVSD